jgi:phosphonate transport system substrate-binding protein
VRTIVTLCCLALLGLGTLPERAAAERSLGIVPQHSSLVTAQRWQPVLETLGKETQISLRFATAPNITDFEDRFLQGLYDYAYVNPLLFLEGQKREGYRALVHDEKPLSGVIVVRSDGPKYLAQLRDKTLAFPGTRAFAATILTRADLKAANVEHRAVYVSSHESAYQAVLQGQHVAAGGALSSFELLPTAQRKRLRVLHTTRAVPSHVLAAHPRVGTAESRRLQEYLLHLHETANGRALLTRLNWSRLQAVQGSDLAVLRAMKFPKRMPALFLHAIPRLEQATTVMQLEPLATHMQQRLETEVTLKTYETMDAFETAVYRETRPSILIANPTQALKLTKQGFEIVAQERPVGSPEGMRGTILVRQDSPYRTLKDLEGKRIAFGGNNTAFFASIVPKVMLKRAGLAGRYQDVSQTGAVSAVLGRLTAGEIDAAGTGNQALRNEVLRQKYGLDKMRVLAQSEPLPAIAWLVGPSLEREWRDAVQQFLTSFGADAPGGSAMRAAGIETILVADRKTYEPVNRYLTEHGPP